MFMFIFIKLNTLFYIEDDLAALTVTFFACVGCDFHGAIHAAS